ncbi:MAG TPA: glycosyltransferase family 9 protein [Chthoniobacterales bacterium]
MIRILAVQLKRLGDLVLTTAALRSLRRAYPDARLTVVVAEYAADLAPALVGVDEILVHRPGRSARFWARLLARRFDASLDFTGTDRSALVSLLSKAPRRVGLRPQGRRPFRRWAYNVQGSAPVRDVHTLDLYLNLVRRLQPAAQPAEPFLELPAATLASAIRIVQELGMETGYFVVQAGSARSEKLWVPERWAEVIRHAIATSGCKCLLTGSGHPMEAEHVEAITRTLGPTVAWVNLAGKTDFLLTCALIQGAQFFLGVDSVAAHVAAVFQRPELVLFGPTNPFHWRPRHQGGRVVRAGFGPEYRPCAPVEKGSPMRELSTGTVIRAMENLRGRP